MTSRSKFADYADACGRAAARFLSSFSYVLTTLLVYVVVCLISYVVVRMTLGANSGASFITFEIATGGDPDNFKELAPAHPVLWIWFLTLHVLSWLIVPVLAATAVDAAYKSWESRMQILDIEIQDEMSGVLKRTVAQLSKQDADRIASEFLTEAQKKFAITKKKP